jgi:hypothetical protein
MFHNLEIQLRSTNIRSIGNTVHAGISRYCSRIFSRRNQTELRKTALMTLNVQGWNKIIETLQILYKILINTVLGHLWPSIEQQSFLK